MLMLNWLSMVSSLLTKYLDFSAHFIALLMLNWIFFTFFRVFFLFSERSKVGDSSDFARERKQENSGK